MTVQPDDKLPKAPVTAPSRWLGAAVVAVLAIQAVAIAAITAWAARRTLLATLDDID